MRTRRGLLFVLDGGVAGVVMATAWASLQQIGRRPFARTAEWGYRAYRRGW